MTTPTIEQAEDLAARTLAAMEDSGYRGLHDPDHRAADHDRVLSDLAGITDHSRDELSGECRSCLGGDYEEYPCVDAERYAEGLIRTATLYGVHRPPATDGGVALP